MAKHFTRAEAEALLPHIEPLLLELQALMATLAQREQEVAELSHKLTGNGHLPPGTGVALQRGISSARAGVARRLRRIIALGVEIKDPTTGLIDFPTMRDGHEVYLCWRLGEGERIRWWHEIEAGFAGRQPLEDEP